MYIYCVKNKNLHITAILFVIFIIATMILSSKFKSSLNPSNLFSQFQKNFYTEKKIFSDGFSTLIDSLSSNLVSHENKLHSFSNANPQDFSFFIYKDDSLIFWSNNEITPPESHISTNGFSIVKLQNGYYQYLNNVVSNYKIVALNLIKHKYSFNNIYLSNSFKTSYNLPADIEINLYKGKYDFNLDGKFVFSLSFPSNLHLPRDKILILFAFYYLLFVLLIIFIYQLYATYKHLIKNKILFVILFSVDVIILRFIISYFKIPQVLFSSFLFSPFDFSFSLFFNSLGDLFLNATAIIAISLFVYKYLDIGQKKTNRKPFSVFFKIFTVFLHFYIFYSLIYALQSSIILDSNFSLDLTNIFDLTLSSYIAMFSLSIILLSYFLIAIKLFHHVFSYFSDNKFLFISALIVSFLLSLLYFYFRSKTTAAFLPLVFILVLFVFRKHYNSITGFYHIVIYILLFAAFTSYIFTRLNTIKMFEDKKILAINLSNSDDPLCEYAFSLSYKQITTDSTIINFLTKSILKLEYEDSASAYLEKKYLNRIFPNYSTFTTVCSQDKILVSNRKII